MLDAPKTLEEARRTRYGEWAGNPNGTPYDPTRCAYEVQRPEGWLYRQCSRKLGYGPGFLYCKQHAKMVGV